MSYLVLARKYRPQTLEAVFGQEHVTRTLASAIARGRLHHAFLLCGARGVGKTTTARILAKAICCEKGPTPTPCDACPACDEIRRGQAIDVIELDAASNRGIDEIRVLRESIVYAPARLRRKVVILDEAHMLTKEAFNALLKTLEEPPAHALFIFATTDPQKMPVTILSRCQRYDFRLVPAALIAAHLSDVARREELEVEPAALAAVARAAQGSVRDALSLFDQIIAYAGAAAITRGTAVEVLGVADRSALLALSAAVLARDVAAALGVVDEQIARGADVPTLARSIAGIWRDLSIVEACKSPAGLVDATAEELEELATLIREVPQGLLRQGFEILTRAVDEIARAPLPRFTLELAVIGLCHAEPLLPLGDLLERLSALEGRLGGASPPRGPTSGPPGRARPGGAATAPVGSAPPASDRARPASAPTGAPVAIDPVPAPAPPARPPEPGTFAPPASGGFTSFVQSLAADHPLEFALLADARLVSVADGGVTLAVPGAFERQQLDAQSAAIGALFTPWLGTPHRLLVTAAEVAASAPSLADEEAQRSRAQRDRILEEERAHPSINHAEQVFGALRREVKVLE